MKLNPARSRLAQALLLVKTLVEIDGPEAMAEEIASSLDPNTPTDDRGKILEMACLHALENQECPVAVCVALLEAWP